MRWAALDSTQFVMPGGDTRCILVSNHAEDPFASQAFYATLEPCNAKLADGLVCESVSAYPREFAPSSPPHVARTRQPEV